MMVCHTSDQKTRKESKLKQSLFSPKPRRYQAQRVDDLPILCIVSFEGLRIDFETKGHPDFTQLSIEMDSLSIQDPNVRQEVIDVNKLQNEDVTPENQVSDYVLMTVHDRVDTAFMRYEDKYLNRSSHRQISNRTR